MLPLAQCDRSRNGGNAVGGSVHESAVTTRSGGMRPSHTYTITPTIGDGV